MSAWRSIDWFPCYRVIQSNGELSGYGGLSLQKELFEYESMTWA